MTPTALDFPPEFALFRDCQYEAFDYCLTSDKRCIALGLPTGSGKSVFALAIGRLFGGRTVILTATKGLQDQYSDLHYPGLIDMRGRSNYSCWSGGSCEDGARLGCADKGGCPYLCQLRASNDADICVTSYAWWLAAHENGNGPKRPDTLILDEAHLGPEWLSKSLDFRIGERELREAGMKGIEWPSEDDLLLWQRLYTLILDAAQQALVQAKVKSSTAANPAARERASHAIKRAESLVDRAQKLAHIDADNWVCTREDGTDAGRLWRFECIWPWRYREKLLQGLGRVILMSATLRPKTFGLLGIKRDDADFREWPRQFPPANGPVVWIPTARMSHRMSHEDKQRWLDRIDEICRWGADRKGLIHTVSYDRAKLIAGSAAAHHASMIVNGAADPDSQTAHQAYDRFLLCGPGAVLVSPSFSTGWDFKWDLAEWQILSKIAFPDTRGKVMQRRCADDRTYSNYIAAQDLQQSAGRIVRSEEDRGMTLIIDDSWSWFGSIASEFLAKSFKVRREDELPRPLEKL